MRTKFPEHYPPNAIEVEALWSTGLVVLDANVLLSVYRCAENTRDQLFKVLESFKGRLWVPNHFAAEYLRRRAKVISDQAKAYKEASERTRKLISEFESDRAPFVNSERLDKLRAMAEELEAENEKIFKLLTDDAHRDRLADLLDGCVGDPPDAETRSAMIEEAKVRFARRIPPGFIDEKKAKKGGVTESQLEQDDSGRAILEHPKASDKKTAPLDEAKDGVVDPYATAKDDDDRARAKSSGRGKKDSVVEKRAAASTDEHNVYGDCIGWLQILRHAESAEAKKPCLLISDDRKEDWWQIESGRYLGPQPALIREYRERCEQRFHMYLPSRFLELAKARGIEVADATIKEMAGLEHLREKATTPSYEDVDIGDRPKGGE